MDAHPYTHKLKIVTQECSSAQLASQETEKKLDVLLAGHVWHSHGCGRLCHWMVTNCCFLLHNTSTLEHFQTLITLPTHNLRHTHSQALHKSQNIHSFMHMRVYTSICVWRCTYSRNAKNIRLLYANHTNTHLHKED